MSARILRPQDGQRRGDEQRRVTDGGRVVRSCTGQRETLLEVCACGGGGAGFGPQHRSRALREGHGDYLHLTPQSESANGRGLTEAFRAEVARTPLSKTPAEGRARRTVSPPSGRHRGKDGGREGGERWKGRSKAPREADSLS